MNILLLSSVWEKLFIFRHPTGSIEQHLRWKQQKFRFFPIAFLRPDAKQITKMYNFRVNKTHKQSAKEFRQRGSQQAAGTLMIYTSEIIRFRVRMYTVHCGAKSPQLPNIIVHFHFKTIPAVISLEKRSCGVEEGVKKWRSRISEMHFSSRSKPVPTDCRQILQWHRAREFWAMEPEDSVEAARLRVYACYGTDPCWVVPFRWRVLYTHLSRYTFSALLLKILLNIATTSFRSDCRE